MNLSNMFKGTTNRSIFAVAVILVMLANLGLSIYLGLASFATGLSGMLTGNWTHKLGVFLISALLLGILDFVALVFVVRRGNEAGNVKLLAGLWGVGMVLDIMGWSFLFFIRPFVFFFLTFIIGLVLPPKSDSSTTSF